VWSPSQAAAERAAKRRSALYSSMNMWPFIGVMVALLFMFMTGPMPIHVRSVLVDLPITVNATAQPKAVREDAIRIIVMRDGKVFFRNQKVLPKLLPTLIRGAVQDGAEKKVYLSVDARSKYGDAAVAVEQIGRAGISEICFLAEKRER
jgi:biopolymer transport protein ExbD